MSSISFASGVNWMNLSTLNADILIMMEYVRLMMFSLNMVDYFMFFLSLTTRDFFGWSSRGDQFESFLLFEVYCGTPPSCLKVMGGVVGWVGVAPWDFSVSPRPLGFGFLGFWVWGLGVWALALTILSSSSLSPLVTYLAFELGLTGLRKGLGGLGTKSMGLGLDNFQTEKERAISEIWLICFKLVAPLV